MMDPQKTWDDMLNALQRKQWDEAKELADNLYGWLRRRGFPPTTVGDESLGKQWHDTVAQFVCLIVANKVNEIHKRRRRREREEAE